MKNTWSYNLCIVLPLSDSVLAARGLSPRIRRYDYRHGAALRDNDGPVTQDADRHRSGNQH